MKKKITILIPAYNEEQVLPMLKDRLYSLGEALPKYNLEFLFINDGSRDGTMQFIRDQQRDGRVSYVNYAALGKEASMTAIYPYKSDAQVIITTYKTRQNLSPT